MHCIRSCRRPIRIFRERKKCPPEGAGGGAQLRSADFADSNQHEDQPPQRDSNGKTYMRCIRFRSSISPSIFLSARQLVVVVVAAIATSLTTRRAPRSSYPRTSLASIQPIKPAAWAHKDVQISFRGVLRERRSSPTLADCQRVICEG